MSVSFIDKLSRFAHVSRDDIKHPERMSEKDLKFMLSEAKLPESTKDALATELCKRLEERLNAGNGTPEDARLLQLLQKQINGSISDSEKNELRDLLKVSDWGSGKRGNNDKI